MEIPEIQKRLRAIRRILRKDPKSLVEVVPFETGWVDVFNASEDIRTTAEKELNDLLKELAAK